MRISHLGCITLALLALVACGGEENTSVTAASGSTGGDTSTTGTSTTNPTTTPTTMTTDTSGGMTGTTTTGPTTGPETTGPMTTSPETTSPETTSPETTGPETTGPETSGSTTDVGSTGVMGSTGEMGSTGVPPEGCAALGPQQCMANDACMAIVGQQINVQKMCLQKAVFLECADAAGCGDALTIGCPMGTTEQWQFPDTCLPSDYEACEGMVIMQQCK